MGVWSNWSWEKGLEKRADKEVNDHAGWSREISCTNVKKFHKVNITNTLHQYELYGRVASQ